MKLIKYLGPFEVLEIDGIRLVRDGPPVELSAEQIRRLRWTTRNCHIEFVKPPKATKPKPPRPEAAKEE